MKLLNRIFYGTKNTPQKVWIGLKSIFIRLKDLSRANSFEYVYIYRDAFFFGIFFEWLFRKSKAKLVFDFDDAIWLMDRNPNQGIFNRLKSPNKVSKIISLSDKVIVGNEYLRQYASQYNTNVEVIPSTIDFDKYRNIIKKENDRICIGWTGSFLHSQTF